MDGECIDLRHGVIQTGNGCLNRCTSNGQHKTEGSRFPPQRTHFHGAHFFAPEIQTKELMGVRVKPPVITLGTADAGHPASFHFFWRSIAFVVHVVSRRKLSMGSVPEYAMAFPVSFTGSCGMHNWFCQFS